MTRFATLLVVAALIGCGGNEPSHEGWTVDFDEAAAQAKAEGKPMLVYFTGKDW